MAKKISKESVDLLLQNMQQLHDKQIETLAVQLDTLKEKNRDLEANLYLLQEREDKVTKALISAEIKGEEIKRSYELTAQLEWKRLKAFADKWKALLLDMQADLKEKRFEVYSKYADDFAALLGQDYNSFMQSQDENLKLDSSIISPSEIMHDIIEDDLKFNINDILYPSKELNLEQLCRDLGLMEEEKEQTEAHECIG